VEENYKPFYQEEGIVIVQAIIDNLFEEALGFRVSSEYGGGQTPPRRNDTLLLGWYEGHTKLIYEVHRTSRTYGGAAGPTSLLNTFIRSTSIHSAIFWVYHHDGGGGEEAHSP
jgi:hypothetical protein